MTTRHNTNLSPALSIGIAVISGIPLIVNITYVIVCFKAIKKKLHNLLVLSLCISDSFLGLSTTWYIVGSLVDSIKSNVGACLFQTFAMCYGTTTSYGLILIICLERYAVVKNMNFGVQKTMDRFKYVMIGGSLAYLFIYTLETVLFVPHQATITSCSLPNLYGDQYHLFITFMVGIVTLIMLMIVAVAIRTSYLIWNIFYWNKKINPIVAKEGNVSDSLSNNTMERNSNHIKTKESSQTVLSFQLNKDEISSAAYPSTSAIGASPTMLEETMVKDVSTNPKTTSAALTMDDNPSKIQEIIQRLKLERCNVRVTADRPLRRKELKKTFKFDAWEFRAFVTSIIIALTTFLLTGPLLLSFWIDYFSGTLLPLQTRFMLFIPLVMNSVLNPFIYAWRLPEIRQEFKKIFGCFR